MFLNREDGHRNPEKRERHDRLGGRPGGGGGVLPGAGVAAGVRDIGRRRPEAEEGGREDRQGAADDDAEEAAADRGLRRGEGGRHQGGLLQGVPDQRVHDGARGLRSEEAGVQAEHRERRFGVSCGDDKKLSAIFGAPF